MEIKDRIIEFLRAENISSASFAQEIGVQASGISHIISGRNKPSLDFIVKMLNRYPSLSTEWILFGKGKMLKANIPGDLFSNETFKGTTEEASSDIFDLSGKTNGSSRESKSVETEKQQSADSVKSEGMHKAAERLVIFYHDHTFKEFFPG